MSDVLVRVTGTYPTAMTRVLQKIADERELRFAHGPLGAVSMTKRDQLLEPGFLEPRAPVVFTAHKDQIGVRVSYFDDDGFAFVVPVGGWDPQILVGQRMVFDCKDGEGILGAVGRKATHLIKEEDAKQAVKLEDLWVDFGCKSRDEVAKKVAIGAFGVVQAAPQYLGENRLCARALDDLAGVSAIINAMERITTGRPVHAVFTDHEETIQFGSVGDWVAQSKPELIVAVDVTFAEDPDTKPKDNGNLRMGAGAVIYHGGMLDPVRSQKVVALAAVHGIPLQEAVTGGETSTDADGMALGGGGQSVLLLSVPIRYMHTPIEVIDLTDYESLVKLLVVIHEAASNGQL